MYPGTIGIIAISYSLIGIAIWLVEWSLMYKRRKYDFGENRQWAIDMITASGWVGVTIYFALTGVVTAFLWPFELRDLKRRLEHR